MVEVKTTNEIVNESSEAFLLDPEGSMMDNKKKRWVCLDSVGSGFPEKEYDKIWKQFSSIGKTPYHDDAARWGWVQRDLQCAKEREDLKAKMRELAEKLKPSPDLINCVIDVRKELLELSKP